MQGIDTPNAQQRWLPCVNTTGETIPAFGCIYFRHAGLESDYLANGSNVNLVYEAEKPAALAGTVSTWPDLYNSDPSVTVWVNGYGFGFNSRSPIAPNQSGVFTTDLPTVALIDDSQWPFGGIRRGITFVPEAGKWNLRAEYYANLNSSKRAINVFQRIDILGHLDAGDGLLYAMIKRHSV